MSKSHKRITSGTKEWADSNVNCYSGCSNNCRYCYAKKMAIRFNRKTEDTWKMMVPNLKSIDKGYNKRNGRVMFPTSHDITEESVDNCLFVLQKLLDSRNSVLITTKPKFDCIKLICDKFGKYKEQIQFRFTITSTEDELLEFWEPKAPLFKERFNSLKFAFIKGYKTSVSIEPFLDKDPYVIVDKLVPFVTESLWIGKMNYVYSKNLGPSEKRFYDKIWEINTKENLIKIVNKAGNYEKPVVRIKDSIFNFISQ